MGKKLFLSDTNRKIAGVCGGLAEYFNIDPTIMRLIFIGATLLHGISLLIYIVAWIVIPKKKLLHKLLTFYKPSFKN